MGMYRNVQLWQSLPAKAEFEFQERSDILALDETMENLSLKLAALRRRIKFDWTDTGLIMRKNGFIWKS